MYDYTHCISDALEGITHSICSLEFENNRPLYDWVLDNLPVPGHPQQIEFARLNLSYTVLSKRKLIQLVTEKVVSGWDDPRLPTLSGIRRRGYTPEAIRDFCERIGISKAENMLAQALKQPPPRQHGLPPIGWVVLAVCVLPWPGVLALRWWRRRAAREAQQAAMTFVVGLPEAAVLGPAQAVLAQNTVLLAGTAGLALAVAWFVGGAGIARRLDRIADTADRIGQGELSARTDLRHGTTGIGKVARTIDAMPKLNVW